MTIDEIIELFDKVKSGEYIFCSRKILNDIFNCPELQNGFDYGSFTKHIKSIKLKKLPYWSYFPPIYIYPLKISDEICVIASIDHLEKFNGNSSFTDKDQIIQEVIKAYNFRAFA